MEITAAADKEVDAVLDDLETLLKNPDVGAALTARGINTSLALLIADALRAYLQGKKKDAAEDLGTAAEEIASRLRHGDSGASTPPS